MKPRVIVDCDPGLDDAAALVVANHFADLVGITTVGGNAPLADVTTNALLTAQVFGIDVGVHAGAERPLVAEPRHAPEIHGEHGFDGPTLPELDHVVVSSDAIDYLIETIRGEEGLWLIPTGPMTNIALALRSAPDLAPRLAGISFMGGSATFGNHSAVAEFNILVDPEAAAAVLATDTTIVMAGLDLTHQFVVDDELASRLRAHSTDGAAMLADLVMAYLDQLEAIRGVRRGGLHDPCAVLAVTHPEIVGRTRRRVEVELSGTHTRAMTVVDQRLPPGVDDPTGNVWHGHTLDHPAALAALMEAVAAHG
ncbi:MAG: ribonucleoside hydrolase [Actinomycetia bacterium]|nr:ribonucleoside hydrolase [Actinomycetes bacterium]MCP4223020.1 ribonucleoside hydrolase [Actinomycetes bacterium]MCP5032023.1 ribonucleoside hydrolase [Actinomycetes bacterium]